MKWTEIDKKQLKIYAAIAFGIPFLLGLLMWYGSSQGRNMSVFPNAQMLYPAAGVMVLLLVTKKKEEVPRRFFISYLITTVLMIGCAVGSAFTDDAMVWVGMTNLVLIFGSIVCGILMLTEKREKRSACGLKGQKWGLSVFCILLFAVLYLLRQVIACIMAGEPSAFTSVLADPMTWYLLVVVLINYVFVFIAFFGEEYGWRYFLQPMLQKRFGKRMGVIFVGVVWGLWHMPLDFFFYTADPGMGLISVVAHQITCITLGIFFAYAYMKTGNIWVPTILHFLNNNLIAVLAGNMSEEVIAGQEMYWSDLLPALLINGILFGIFLLAKEFRKGEPGNESGKESGKDDENSCICDTSDL